MRSFRKLYEVGRILLLKAAVKSKMLIFVYTTNYNWTLETKLRSLQIKLSLRAILKCLMFNCMALV